MLYVHVHIYIYKYNVIYIYIYIYIYILTSCVHIVKSESKGGRRDIAIDNDGVVGKPAALAEETLGEELTVARQDRLVGVQVAVANSYHQIRVLTLVIPARTALQYLFIREGDRQIYRECQNKLK